MDVSGDTRSVNQLVEQHYVLIYRYLYRLSGSAEDAEDLTQQTFLTAQTKLHQLRDSSRTRGWLCTIARNAYLKSRRSGGGTAVVSLDDVGDPADAPPTESVIDKEELQNTLNELPEEFRTPLILFYFDEFTYKEIADQLEVPIGTVMSRLARAKSYLRRRLSAQKTAAVEK